MYGFLKILRRVLLIWQYLLHVQGGKVRVLLYPSRI